MNNNTGSVDRKRLVNLFRNLVSIDSESYHERKMADYLKKVLQDLSLSAEEDETGRAINGEAGCLFCRIAGCGELAGEKPVLFTAHMDTVAPGRDKKAILLKDQDTITSDGSTVLGADDLAAISAILEAVREVTDSSSAYRPAELLFTPAEEAYTAGAGAFDFSKIHASAAYALDLSDRIGSYSVSEPTLIEFRIVITGREAHSGFNPEEGISAIRAAAKSISRLPEGRVNSHTTFNIGMIEGGSSVNCIPGKTVLRGELRSSDDRDAGVLFNHMVRIFQEEAEDAGADIQFFQKRHLTAYRIPEDDPALVQYQDVLHSLGIRPSRCESFGGSDINVLRRKGIDGICLASAMYRCHTRDEYTKISEMTQCCEIVKRLLQQKPR